jgi:hypothetical protein
MNDASLPTPIIRKPSATARGIASGEREEDARGLARVARGGDDALDRGAVVRVGRTGGRSPSRT